jgi:hypothetical protein
MGVLAGGLMMWACLDTKISHFMTSTGNPAAMAKRIDRKYAKDLQLSADEATRIEPLTREMAQRLYEARKKFGTSVLEILDTEHEKIAEQMTPEHRSAYGRANEERKKRMASMLLLDSSAEGEKQK